jgi:hypothetical protein
LPGLAHSPRRQGARFRVHPVLTTVPYSVSSYPFTAYIASNGAFGAVVEAVRSTPALPPVIGMDALQSAIRGPASC